MPALTPPSKQLLWAYYTNVVTLVNYIENSFSSAAGCEIIRRIKADPKLMSHAETVLVGHSGQTLEQMNDVPSPPSQSAADVFMRAIAHIIKHAKSGFRNVLAIGYIQGNNSKNGQRHPQASSVVNQYPNTTANELLTPVWIRLLDVLGETFWLHLICETSMFVPIGNDCFYQLSGDSLADLPLPNHCDRKRKQKDEAGRDRIPPKRTRFGLPKERTNNEILLQRSKIFFSRPLLDKRGKILAGLPSSHVLSHAASAPVPVGRRILLASVFPLQFGRHSILTDSTTREATIPLRTRSTVVASLIAPGRLPKSVQGARAQGVVDLLENHQSCPYDVLLNYYCPDPCLQSSVVRNQHATTSWSIICSTEEVSRSTGVREIPCHIDERKLAFTDFQTSSSQVIAWLRAVMLRLVSPNLLNADALAKLLQGLPALVSQRRFETQTLHQYLQGMPLAKTARKLSQSEYVKEKELQAELVYWLLDSLAMSLIRVHFYVTESQMFRNRVLFFRHSVWKRLTEPEIARVKLHLFSELPKDEVISRLRARSLGYSYLRFLPKERGARPIANLRRRQKPQSLRDQSPHTSAPSINSILQAVHSILTSSDCVKPSTSTFSIASTKDMHLGLKRFKRTLLETGCEEKLYFCKIDIKNCFDSIRVDVLLKIIADVLVDDKFMLRKFCALVPGLDGIGRRYATRASPLSTIQGFPDYTKQLAQSKKHALLTDGVLCQVRERQEVFELLTEHLSMNIVQIGQAFYKQRTGIPQGSVLSALLCDFYFNDFERTNLSWAQTKHSVGFRMVDDFLYITTNLRDAKRFFQVMHAGSTDYGFAVNPTKSLSNFEAVILSTRIECLTGTLEFPYCGTTINTASLDVRKDYTRAPRLRITDTLTIYRLAHPGQGIVPRIFRGIKLSCQPIFVDPTSNGLRTVVINIYRSFIFAGMRLFAYIKGLPRLPSSPGDRQVVILSELANLTHAFLKSRTSAALEEPGHQFRLELISWMMYTAYLCVLKRKVSSEKYTVQRLRHLISGLRLSHNEARLLCACTGGEAEDAFIDYRY